MDIEINQKSVELEEIGAIQIQDEICLSDSVDPQELAEIAQRLPDAQAYGRMAELFKLLGDSTRLRIVVALLERDLCVHDLVALLNSLKTGQTLSQSAISHQLRLMRSAQIVRAERQGQRVRYSLIDQHIRELVASSLAHARED
ncbi:MAG: metalloregulator ArsR/SmtB family transcription factor [Chloroflexota bacterium]|nr:helix-turn-helix transcriptional regulator [Chloroflexota bacterium]